MTRLPRSFMGNVVIYFQGWFDGGFVMSLFSWRSLVIPAMNILQTGFAFGWLLVVPLFAIGVRLVEVLP